MWNVLYISFAMLGFGVVHSLTAGVGLKDRLERWFGRRLVEGWYRLAYNALSALTLLPALALVILLPDRMLFRLQFPLSLIPMAFQLFALIGLAYSLHFIDVLRLIGLRQVWEYLNGKPLPLAPEPLQQRGLYALVRHPQYFLAMLVIWATPILTLNWLTFNVASTLYIVIGSRIEERRLEVLYGASYHDYKRRVPWLLPCPRRARI